MYLNSIIFFNLTDIVLPNSMPKDGDLKLSINVYYSYKKRVKEPFYFLHIGNDLTVLGKVDQQFIVMFISDFKFPF